MKRRQHYIKGARFENEARKLLEESGWMVMRSAGSKGMFDLAAFGGHGCRLIQVKGRTATKAEREGMQLIAGMFPSSIHVELWERTGPKQFDITRLNPVKKAVPDAPP